MQKARRRLWLVSPEGFRELRHACLLSRKQAAAYLGVCVRTVRHWEAGRNRVPWSVVRLLRLRRSGELGGLLDGWEGWTIWRDRLVSPDGRVFFERDMRHLWLTLTQAALFREGYDLATAGGVGAQPLRAREGVSQAGDDLHPCLASTPAAQGAPLGRQAHPSHAKHAFDRGRGELAGAADAERSRRQPSAAAPASDAAPGKAEGGRGSHDARMTPQCSHEGAESGVTLEACKMAQTASVSHSSPFGHVPEFLPLANRGGTTLNGQPSDVSLTPSCKGVA